MNRVEELWYTESIRVHNWMDDPCEFWSDRRRAFRAAVDHSDVKFVFEEDDTVIGFVLKRPDNYISEIFVDHERREYPDGRSKEIGRALLKPLKESYPYLTASV